MGTVENNFTHVRDNVKVLYLPDNIFPWRSFLFFRIVVSVATKVRVFRFASAARYSSGNETDPRGSSIQQ